MTQENLVEQSAQGPRRARTAAGEVEQHQLADQIAADKYLSAKKVTNPFLAMRVGSFTPPGANGVYPQ